MLSHQNNVIFKVFPVIFYTKFVTVIIANTYSGPLNKYCGLKQHGFTITHFCNFSWFPKYLIFSLISSFSNFLTSSRLVRFFRLTAPAAVLGHLGAISLKLPNFLTTSQDVTKGADQATYDLFHHISSVYQFPGTWTTLP